MNVKRWYCKKLHAHKNRVIQIKVLSTGTSTHTVVTQKVYVGIVVQILVPAFVVWVAYQMLVPYQYAMVCPIWTAIVSNSKSWLKCEAVFICLTNLEWLQIWKKYAAVIFTLKPSCVVLCNLHFRLQMHKPYGLVIK